MRETPFTCSEEAARFIARSLRCGPRHDPAIAVAMGLEGRDANGDVRVRVEGVLFVIGLYRKGDRPKDSFFSFRGMPVSIEPATLEHLEGRHLVLTKPDWTKQRLFVKRTILRAGPALDETKAKAKRWVFAVLAVIVAGFAALNVLAYNHARAMMCFTSGGSRTGKPEKLAGLRKAKVLLLGVNVPRPVSDRPPSDLDPICRRLSIRCPDGVTLGCWYTDRGAKTALVVLFHGYGAEKTCLLQEARAFLGLGASVLLVDFRGSGESSEAYTTIGFREATDVSAVMRYARDSLHHSFVILYGQSMGAVAILRAVNQDSIKPDAVIVEAVFDSMLNTVRHRFESMGVPSFPSAELLVFWGGIQSGFYAFTHNPVAYARSLACPALFMHGTDDPRAKVEEGRRVFAAVPGAKRFKEFPAIGHESYVSRYPAEWKATVEAFLSGVHTVHTGRSPP